MSPKIWLQILIGTLGASEKLTVRKVFADTNYWIAVISPKDQLHGRALEVTQELGVHKVFTSESVLTELLNYFSDKGDHLRDMAIRMTDAIRKNPNVIVISQTGLGFEAAFELYKSRLDKGYSLTDCDSMQHMWQHGINDILTTDHHFRQEGFLTLL